MGTVRIISGALRGRAVRTPEGEATRPLLSRLRKTLVDILRPQLPDTRVLDLFGGSGAVAFELLSNGAREAWIVELDLAAAELIRQNAGDLEAPAHVLTADALDAIPELAASGERFDIIVVAPPYGKDLQRRALASLGRNGILAEGGTVVVQRDRGETGIGAAGTLRCFRTRRHGRTAFDFYRNAPT